MRFFDIMEYFIPIGVAIISYAVLSFLGQVLIGVVFYILIASSGTLFVFVKQFKLRKVSVWFFLMNNLVTISVTILLFALVFTIPMTETDYMVTSGTPATLSFQEGLYYSIFTFTTLGYGDIGPHGFFMWFTALEALMGVIWSGIFIAGVTLVLYPKDEDSNLTKRRKKAKVNQEKLNREKATPS